MKLNNTHYLKLNFWNVFLILLMFSYVFGFFVSLSIGASVWSVLPYIGLFVLMIFGIDRT